MLNIFTDNWGNPPVLNDEVNKTADECWEGEGYYRIA